MAQGRVNIIDATPVEAARSGRGKGKDGKRVRDTEAGLHVKRDSRGRMKAPEVTRFTRVWMRTVSCIARR